MTKARRNFDLPAIHIDTDPAKNWVPPKAFEAEEIARRKNLPEGSVLREYQVAGANVAQALYNFPFTEPVDVQYTHRKLAMALLNTAWYTFADSAKTSDIFMRRKLDLPILADDSLVRKVDDDGNPIEEDESEKWRATKNGILTRTRAGLGSSANLAALVLYQHREGIEKRKDSEKKLGQAMGNTALNVIALEHANAPLGMSDVEIQDLIMLYGTNLLVEARDSHKETGVHVSVAQLADPDSPLSVYWRTHAPRSSEAKHALFEAQETFGIKV